MLTALAFALFVIVAVLIAMRILRRQPVPAPVYDKLPTPVEAASFGVRAFSIIAALAIVLATLFALSSVHNPWLYGLIAGLVFVTASEFIVRKYAVPGNAIAGAGLAMLFASLYAMAHGGITNLWLTIVALVVITAATIRFALHRNSLYVGLIAISGAFLTPLLIGFDDEGVLLFSFLLLLNIAAAWLAIARGWAVLIAISVPVTTLYEWAWVLRNSTNSRLPLTAAMFALIALAGASPLWVAPRGDHPLLFRRCAAASALLPLLFAFYMALVPNYALRYNVLFAFLFVIALGLASAVWRGAPRYLHLAGGMAVLFTFLLWFVHWFNQSTMYQLWPVTLVPGLTLAVSIWTALFIILYLFDVRPIAGLLFFVYLGLTIRQPQGALWMIVVMLLILAFAVFVLKRREPWIAATAIAFASLALIALTPLPLFFPLFPAHALQNAPFWLLLLVAHAIVFAAIFIVAKRSRRYSLAVLAVPFYAAMVALLSAPGPVAKIFIALVPYALFLAFAFFVRDAFPAYVAAALASLVFLLAVWAALDDTPLRPYIGVVPLLQSIVFAILLWRTATIEPPEPRFTLLAATTLAFFSAAVPLLLPDIWTVMVWSALVAALMLVFARLQHPAFVVWALGLGTVIFLRLAFEADLDRSRTTFIVAGLAMFVAAFFANGTLRDVFSLFGLTELLFRINIELANHYKTTGGSLNLDLLHQRPDAAYTIAWSIVATSLLFIGVHFDWRGARIGAVSLLSLAIAKCFFHDLRYLHGDYRIAALAAVGITLVIAGALLQRFVNRSAHPASDFAR